MDSLRRRRQRAGRVLNRLAAQRRQVLRASVLLPRRLLDRCSVLGTTVHQTYVSRELKRQYDVVVIDEASMTQTAQVYACSALARTGGKVIVAGDFRQIPPVVAAKTLRARTWLATDIFHTVGIPDDLERDDAPPYLAMLVEQHRMSPGICAIVDHLFYGDRLKTHPSVRSRPCLPTPLGETDVFYVDSSARVPRVRSPDRKTRANEVHVDIVEDLLAELDSGGAIPRTGQRQVAVIAPFRGQVEAIRKRLGKRYHGRGVDVSTGHKSQGGEAEIVILDLTDAPGLPISDFLGARSITEAGPRAVNVGMSRARQQLYIVGAMDFLEQAGGRVIRQLVAYLRENAQHVRPAQIRGSAAKVYGHMEKKSLAPSLHRRGAPAGSHAGGRRHTRGTAAS